MHAAAQCSRELPQTALKPCTREQSCMHCTPCMRESFQRGLRAAGRGVGISRLCICVCHAAHRTHVPEMRSKLGSDPPRMPQAQRPPHAPHTALLLRSGAPHVRPHRDPGPLRGQGSARQRGELSRARMQQAALRQPLRRRACTCCPCLATQCKSSAGWAGAFRVPGLVGH